jgi:TRAP-type C4-dicarboxylate transport system permease small subunit
MAERGRRAIFWVEFAAMVGGGFMTAGSDLPYAGILGAVLMAIGCLMLIRVLVSRVPVVQPKNTEQRPLAK